MFRLGVVRYAANARGRAASHSEVLLRLALSLPPKALPACVFDLLGVSSPPESSFSDAFWMELMIAVVNCFAVISDTLRLLPPCSPFLSRSLRILSRSSNDNFSHSAGE